MICIYHSRDLDGWCSGAIMKRKFPDATFIGWDYGEAVPYSDLPEGEEVIMADISFPMEDMVIVAETSGNQLTWIDHHISAIKDYQDYAGKKGAFCTAVLDDSISACEATWKHLFPDEDMPRAVELLGVYDTWRQEEIGANWDKTVIPFQYGMRARCAGYDEFDSNLLLPRKELMQIDHEYLEKIVKEGGAIIQYQDKQNATNCEKNSFEKIFGGYRAICLCGGPFNSKTFESVYDESRHDLMMPFQYCGKTSLWTVSLYTTKDYVDCSELARSQGGGGHRKAAGFQVPHISNITMARDSSPETYLGVAKEEYDFLNNHNNELLLTLSKDQEDLFVMDVEQLLQDCNVRDKFSVVDEAKGPSQGSHRSLKEVCIDVISSEEARTEGNFYAKLKDGKWLKMPYST